MEGEGDDLSASRWGEGQVTIMEADNSQPGFDTLIGVVSTQQQEFCNPS